MNSGRLLLHVCCAPDATVPWPVLLDEGYDVTGFFYGNNIHPEDEWRLRRDACTHLAAVLEEALVVLPYEPGIWFDGLEGLEDEPEGGARCALCFEKQLSSAAKYAREHGFASFCTTLTISPHKDVALIDGIGRKIGGESGIEWVSRVWRKNGGFGISVQRSRDLGLYRQSYCGCSCSVLRKGGGDSVRS